jgi:predicted extracellular nuclease
MSAGSGVVALADSGTPRDLGGDSGDLVDLVGYGTATAYEGSAPAPGLGNTTSDSRDVAGTDTDDNAADFTAGTPAPQASGDSQPSCSGAMTIAQIQGTDAASRCDGDTVTTSGVVTASYPVGGFNGFFIQTPGTGGDLDLATHHASDGIFVFLGSRNARQAPSVNTHVQVSGTVDEYFGLTEIDADPSGITVLAEAQLPKAATVPWPRSEAQRESLEGMLLEPQGSYTVSDNYGLNQYGEIGVASGTMPLRQPTDVADPHDSEAIHAVEADNAARLVTLDDGSSWNYLSNQTAQDTPLPYLTGDQEIRVGAPVTFTSPMVVDYRFDLWRLQPTTQLTGDGLDPVSFGHTRTDAPATTGGDVHIASFNVLNYFPTTGADYEAAGGDCTSYNDRDGNPVTVRSCTSDAGPRGAWDDADLARQQAKIVHAINHLGADVVSLEEIENSAKFGQDRDAAVATLVRALNTAAGARAWAYVPTPASAGDQADEDVIRTAFVYKPASVRPVGESIIDDAPAFDNARDPLAQAFRPVGGGHPADFAVIVNHFKSKGSGPDDGTGQGNSNPARIEQAHELVRFADRVQQAYDTGQVYLSGDFNSYTREDPMQVLYDAGYTDIGSALAPGEHTYLFDGLVGSLDHVLANKQALGMVADAHVWNINSVEPVALEYSRYNYTVTDFYTDSPYRASDHDPLVVGVRCACGAAHAR